MILRLAQMKPNIILNLENENSQPWKWKIEIKTLFRIIETKIIELKEICLLELNSYQLANITS